MARTPVTIEGPASIGTYEVIPAADVPKTTVEGYLGYDGWDFYTLKSGRLVAARKSTSYQLDKRDGIFCVSGATGQVFFASERKTDAVYSFAHHVVAEYYRDRDGYPAVHSAAYADFAPDKA